MNHQELLRGATAIAGAVGSCLSHFLAPVGEFDGDKATVVRDDLLRLRFLRESEAGNNQFSASEHPLPAEAGKMTGVSFQGRGAALPAVGTSLHTANRTC